MTATLNKFIRGELTQRPLLKEEKEDCFVARDIEPLFVLALYVTQTFISLCISFKFGSGFFLCSYTFDYKHNKPNFYLKGTNATIYRVFSLPLLVLSPLVTFFASSHMRK